MLLKPVTALAAVSCCALSQASIDFSNPDVILEDVLQYLQDEEILTFTDNGFNVDATPFFVFDADVANHNYDVNYANGNLVEFRLNDNVNGEIVTSITHSGDASKIAPEMDFLFEESITFPHITEWINEEHSINVQSTFGDNSVAGGLTVSIADQAGDLNVKSFHASFALTKSFSSSNAATEWFNDALVWENNEHECSVDLIASYEEACVTGDSCEASVSFTFASTGQEGIETTVSSSAVSLSKCTSRGAADCASVTVSCSSMDEDLAARFHVVNGHFRLTLETPEGDIALIHMALSDALNKRGKKLIPVFAKQLLNAEKREEVHFIALKYISDIPEIAGKGVLVKFPTHNHLPVICDAWRAWSSQFTDVITDFGGVTNDVPNALYGAVYIDEVILTLTGKFDLTALYDSTGFQIPLANITPGPVHRVLSDASQQIDIGIAAGADIIADVRETVNEITSSEGEAVFDQAFTSLSS